MLLSHHHHHRYHQRCAWALPCNGSPPPLLSVGFKFAPYFISATGSLKPFVHTLAPLFLTPPHPARLEKGIKYIFSPPFTSDLSSSHIPLSLPPYHPSLFLAMWFIHSALLLATAASSALALWPHPRNFTSNKSSFHTRLSSDLSFNLDPSTDKSRIPSDLVDAINAAAKLANSIDLWPVVPDRGENYRVQVEKSPLITGVEIKVLELLDGTKPNPCIGGGAEGEKVTRRGLQTPFQGRKSAAAAAAAEEANAGDEKEAVDASAKASASDVWSNRCSISHHSIRELSYNHSANPLNLETDKTAPADLGFLDAESYHLSVPGNGTSIRLTSYTSLGALRGLQTLIQLIYTLPPTSEGKSQRTRFIQNVPITISDRPAYPYRGLLLDTARNFFDIPTIKKLLDTMSFVKMNQLHWHATDTQSFPLAFNDEQLKVLAEKGSYGLYKTDKGEVKRMVYTEEEVKEVIDYAAARGINVIIETDMPAHMLEGVQAVDKGELMACPNSADWASVAAEPPSGQLRLVSNWTASDTTNVDTYSIPSPISDFVSSLLRKVSSLSKSFYVSSGGDEPNFHCWNLSSESAMEPYLNKFMSLVTNVTAKAGKKGMVWEEMAVKFPTVAKTLAKGSLVEIWNDANNSAVALKNNPDVNIVLAPVGYFYLDCGGASFLGNFTSNLWCPYVSWQQTYSFDPAAVVANATTTLTDAKAIQEVKEKFVGGEHAVWSETIDPTNLESKVWPRAAAGAEIWWTGEEVNGGKRDKVEALGRMIDLRWRLVEMGVRAEPLQPQWCAERIGQCNWRG